MELQEWVVRDGEWKVSWNGIGKKRKGEEKKEQERRTRKKKSYRGNHEKDKVLGRIFLVKQSEVETSLRVTERERKNHV